MSDQATAAAAVDQVVVAQDRAAAAEARAAGAEATAMAREEELQRLLAQVYEFAESLVAELAKPNAGMGRRKARHLLDRLWYRAVQRVERRYGHG